MSDTGTLFKCTQCGEAKVASAFPPRRAGIRQLHSWCRACFAAYNTRHHEANRDRERARIGRNQARMRAMNRERIRSYLLTHPCVDCGERDVVVLDFDHVRGTKRADIASMLHLSWTTIELEIAKCEVRCSNDHRRATRKRERERRAASAIN